MTHIHIYTKKVKPCEEIYIMTVLDTKRNIVVAEKYTVCPSINTFFSRTFDSFVKTAIEERTLYFNDGLVHVEQDYPCKDIVRYNAVNYRLT
jgi:predicted nucleotide-binding protein (sugar kinase/HSP70/actin superfamily)